MYVIKHFFKKICIKIIYKCGTQIKNISKNNLKKNKDKKIQI